MKPTYLLLDKSLHGYAEEAREYFSSVYGLAKSRFEIETKISPDIGYKPTLHAVTKDQTLLCVEVVNSYTESLEGFVLGCINEGAPVELYLAVPFNSTAGFNDIVRAAKSNVGILQVGGSSPVRVRSAVPLSLASVGRPRPQDYPKKYRAAVAKALATFLESDPASGTLLLYKEIEDVTRLLAAEVDRRGCWRALKQGRPSPGLNWEKDPWQNVNEALLRHLDANKLKCAQLTVPLLARVLGLVDYRNLVGHKPKTVAARINRDRAIRPRFELAADALRELLDAVKPLKL